MERVIVSLAAISSRMDLLHLTLESLLAQDYGDFEVRVYSSREPFLIDEGVSQVPEACRALMARDRRLKWFFVPNIGSYRKLLPTLADPDTADALIATADDDTVYPPNWLSVLVQAYRRHHCIVSYRGHFMGTDEGAFLRYRRWMTAQATENPSVRCLPTGKDGVLYHRAFFDPAVFDIRTALRIARTVDDLWFKWHSAICGVPVFLVHLDYRTGSLETTLTGDSLYKAFNEGGANDIAVAALEQHAQAAFGRRLIDVIEPAPAVVMQEPARLAAAKPGKAAAAA